MTQGDTKTPSTESLMISSLGNEQCWYYFLCDQLLFLADVRDL